MIHKKWNKIVAALISNKGAQERFDNSLYEYLVVAEDHRFWWHFGFDIISLARAIWRTKIKNKREGGSTIAMQLVRTITQDYRPSIKRKISEIYLASKTTLNFNRTEILNCYLSVAYFGWNMHGIDQACEKLGLDCNNLTKYEAASLVARLKYPEPRQFSERKNTLIRNRTFHILNRLERLEANNSNGTLFSAKRIKKAQYNIS